MVQTPTFQSTHPVRGATTTLGDSPKLCIISIHAPRAGCDRLCLLHRIRDARFQSTHPVRGATYEQDIWRRPRCISIHAPRAGCDQAQDTEYQIITISIHAPRAGCDDLSERYNMTFAISIHAPRAGCDNFRKRQYYPTLISIHAPRAGCDPVGEIYIVTSQDFNPRTPCGVRLAAICVAVRPLQFQSTHPVRGATRRYQYRAGRKIYFNPRTPCGVRPLLPWIIDVGLTFQSTHPVRGATAAYGGVSRLEYISIHAPRAGCDGSQDAYTAEIGDFNPRTPCGVRPRRNC